MKRQVFAVLALSGCLSGWATVECPNVCSNAYLWLDASQTNTMTFSGSEITEWRSMNGGATAAKYALASQSPSGPVIGADGLVSFGATTANRDLGFAKSAKVRTVFMVAKIQQNGNAFFLGDRTAYDFHRGTNGEYWHSSHGKPKNGKTYWNGVQVASPTVEKIPNELGLVTVETAGDLTASQLCYDRTGNGATARRGGKDVAELLIFEKVLAADERRGIEAYLMAKWNIGDCQTLLVTGSPVSYPNVTNAVLYGSVPTTNGTFAIVNTTVGAADVTLTGMPQVAKLDLAFTMKTALKLPGGGTAAFTVPSGSKVTVGNGGWLGPISAADATSEIRFAGEEPIDWPFVDKGTTFPGIITLACPISDNGRQYLYGNKNVVFDAGSSLTTEGLNLGNEKGAVQSLTIRGGEITLTGSVEPTTTSGSIIIAHWPSRVSWTLEAGSFMATNAATMLGWDGHADLTVSGGKMALKGLLANRASSSDNTSSVVLSGGELSVGEDGVDFTGRGDRNASFTLAGGTLSCREDAVVRIEHANGLNVTAASTLAAGSNATLSIAAPLKGAGDLFLDAPCGTIAFADISGWTGAFTVADGTRLYFEARQSAAEILARVPVEVVRLPANVTAEQCTVRIVNADTGQKTAATVEIKDGVLIATAEKTEEPEAPLTLDAPLTNAVSASYLTAAALVKLPKDASGDVLFAQCTGGYAIWLNAAPNESGVLELRLGNTQDGTRADYGVAIRVMPGQHQFALAMSATAGTTLYVDGAAVQTQTGLRFSSNPFTSARIGFAGVGLYAWDVLPGAVCSVTYPTKAEYPEANVIATTADDDGLVVGNISYPAAPAAATVKAVLGMPETFAAGPVASWDINKNSDNWVVEAYRENERSTKVAWRNAGETVRHFSAQNTNALDNTGTKVLNFTYNNGSGSDVALNAQYAASSSATKWGGSKVTGVKLAIKSGMILGERALTLGSSIGPDPAHPLGGLAEEPAWYPGASGGMQDYYRDIVVDTLGTYEPPTVTINGEEVTGGESARVIYLFAGDRTEPDDYKLELGAPVVVDGNVSLSFSGAQPVNASLQLLENAGLTNGWTVAAELPPYTSERTFVLGSESDNDFYFARATENATPVAAQGMPIVTAGTASAYLGSLEGSEGLEVQLEGAGVAEGMAGYLVSGGTAYVSRVSADGRLVFNAPSSADYALNLVVPAGATNGNIRVASPAVTSIAYPDALITEVVADTPVNDGFATTGFASEYRIPSLVSDGAGEVLCCYDVRYGATDLGYYYKGSAPGGIDIGETYSCDGGLSFAAPKIGVDVPNFRRPDGVWPYGNGSSAIAKTNDLGDVSMLYDPVTEKYWMMGITGGGLSTVRYNPDTADVVMYMRGKGKDSPWVAWNNGLGDDPLEYRSVKYLILDQPGITNGVGLGSGFLQGPGHGMVTKIGKAGVMPVGTLVFPVQYFLNGSTVGAIYSKDHGTNWIATARSTAGTNPQENCVMELDDGSWYMTTKAGSRPGTGRINFFRTTNYTNWVYVGEYNPVPCQQGSCLRLGTNATDGKGRYVLCHTLHPDTATRSRVALVFGVDTTADGAAGVSWDFDHPLMLYYENTGFKGYNSLCMVDENTLGVLYEAQGHIYFIRIDVSGRLM